MERDGKAAKLPISQAMRLGVCVAWLVVLGGCGGIGSHTVAPDRFDYTEALSTSWKQQMLANMVKLRYGDAPVFLDVASVINQYSVETQVDLRWTWVHPVVSVGDSQSTGGSAKYSDRPTITYMPLAGERFARSLMKPIPPPAILSLIQAGYRHRPADVQGGPSVAELAAMAAGVQCRRPAPTPFVGQYRDQRSESR